MSRPEFRCEIVNLSLIEADNIGSVLVVPLAILFLIQDKAPLCRLIQCSIELLDRYRRFAGSCVNLAQCFGFVRQTNDGGRLLGSEQLLEEAHVRA